MRMSARLLPAAALLLSVAVPAAGLVDVFELALISDPQIREAEANQAAAAAGKPVARGALLPQVSGRANFARTTADGETSTFFGNAQVTRTVDSRDTDAKNWSIELRQSVFRWDQWVRLDQASKQAAQADVNYQSAMQDLIVRVADAYFNVLAAADALASEQGAKEAIGRQLEQAQKRFEVGLIAITDVQEAQAAFDQAVAAEILATRVLANRKESLRAIIDDFPPELRRPGSDMPLISPDPADAEQWVDLAMTQNRQLIATQIGVAITRDDVRIARTGHYPTIDLVATHSETDNEGFSRNFNTLTSTVDRNPTSTDLDNDSVSLQISVPLFSGGSTTARTRQAVQLHRASRERLESVVRETERQTRDTYLGVISDISRVRALRQGMESARTALKATEAGYEVGTRTTVDVLDARRALLLAETNYLRSRYDYLLNSLRLKLAAGTLTTDDLAAIDALLTEGPQGG